MMLRRLKEVERVCEGKRTKTGCSFSERESEWRCFQPSGVANLVQRAGHSLCQSLVKSLSYACAGCILQALIDMINASIVLLSVLP